MVVTTSGFAVLARLTGKANGVTDLRTAEYPGPVALHDAPEIERNVNDVLVDRIIKGLCKPDPNGAGAARTAWNSEAIACTGTFDEINAHFAELEWSDGLPIVPPTVERVNAFLRHTRRSPDERIATLPSANLVATPRNIAVNAVMAGCRPEHMPLLIAVAEALGDERCSLLNVGSTSMLIPYAIVNGPAVKQLGIATGPQLISMGANPAIGRAIGLIVRNIAGFRPGKTYVGTFGYPLAFTLAEDPADNPWEPFHVERGFDPAANTITIGVTNNWGPNPSPTSTPDQSGAQVVLDLLVREITKKDRLGDFPGSGPKCPIVMLMILLSPPVARSLAEAGYSKQDIKQYLYEHTKIPLREYEWMFRHTGPGLSSVRERVEAGIYPPEFLGEPGDMVRILSSPDILHIVVCGDASRNRLMVMVGGHTEPTIKEFSVE